MKRNQKIKLIASFAGVVLAIILGSIYFVPTIKNSPKESKEESKMSTIKTNYDSLMIILLLDTTSGVRQILDSLVQKKIDHIPTKNKKTKK